MRGERETETGPKSKDKKKVLEELLPGAGSPSHKGGALNPDRVAEGQF